MDKDRQAYRQARSGWIAATERPLKTNPLENHALVNARWEVVRGLAVKIRVIPGQEA